MNEQTHFEVFGTIEKLELFSCVTQNIIPGSLVFESPSPFWGYYSENPQDYVCPYYIYIAILTTHEIFDVVRAIQKVKTDFDFDFDAAKGFVKFNDRFFNVIRLRHIVDYKQIKEVQESFNRHGISMLLTSGNWQNVTANVLIKKVISVKELSNGVYIDDKEAHHSYIEIPRRLNFEEFVGITQKVRNNWMGNKFDAALGAFLQEKKVIEVVRIYSENQEQETLEAIHKLYLQKMLRS